MNNEEFVKKLKNVLNYNTVYGKGTFGQPVTNGFIDGKLNQYPDWYKSRESFFRSLVGKNYFAFDCVGLVKGILWGWSGNPNASHGGAIYQSNGVPDVTESGMLSLCNNVTTDFTNVPLGAFLWVDGHCGVYIGNKQAIECTPKWQNKVQITSVANMGNTSGNYRTWTKWGLLPYIEYFDEFNGDFEPIEDKKTNEEIAKEVIAGKWDVGANRKKKLEAAGYNYNTIQKLVNNMVNNKNVDSDNKTINYTVKKGDSLWSIAQNKLGDGNRYIEIKQLNGMKDNMIYPNQVIKIPSK